MYCRDPNFLFQIRVQHPNLGRLEFLEPFWTQILHRIPKKIEFCHKISNRKGEESVLLTAGTSIFYFKSHLSAKSWVDMSFLHHFEPRKRDIIALFFHGL